MLHRPPGRAGSGGPHLVRGHLCPACAEAVGSLGWSSRSRAVLVHLDSARSHAKKRAEHSVSWSDNPPGPA